MARSTTVGARAGARASQLSFGIAGVNLTIVSDDPSLPLKTPDAMVRFTTGSSHRQTGDTHQPSDADIAHNIPTISLRACWASSSADTLHLPKGVSADSAQWTPIFESGGLWQLHAVDRQLVFTFRSPAFGPAPYKAAVLAPDFSSGTVYLNQRYLKRLAPLYPLEYPLDELIITNWLALGRGVEIHACGVRDADGAGYLFAGQSGAGKTTMATLWHDEPGATILSDDRIILRRSGSRVWMHGTPWHGEEPLAAATCAPLTRAFFLRHASDNAATALSGGHLVARLFASSFPPFYSPIGLAFTTAALSEVAARVPFFDLGFVPHKGALEFARRLG